MGAGAGPAGQGPTAAASARPPAARPLQGPGPRLTVAARPLVRVAAVGFVGGGGGAPGRGRADRALQLEGPRGHELQALHRDRLDQRVGHGVLQRADLDDAGEEGDDVGRAGRGHHRLGGLAPGQAVLPGGPPRGPHEDPQVVLPHQRLLRARPQHGGGLVAAGGEHGGDPPRGQVQHRVLVPPAQHQRVAAPVELPRRLLRRLRRFGIRGRGRGGGARQPPRRGHGRLGKGSGPETADGAALTTSRTSSRAPGRMR